MTRQEHSALKKGAELIELELRLDGKFCWKKATEGSYVVSSSKIHFTVERFGGQTLDQMRARAEEMQRTFGLAFLFNPFELAIDGERLISTETNSILYTEYLRE